MTVAVLSHCLSGLSHKMVMSCLMQTAAACCLWWLLSIVQLISLCRAA